LIFAGRHANSSSKLRYRSGGNARIFTVGFLSDLRMAPGMAQTSKKQGDE
jgi:hypothetical protein